ncbi:hypothetical protein PR048_022868 [Dryococelus australis]|uniref:Uncharacterized protein n=1 Tax=Dryococelus australis TaxID=614101 RepID=A0ABQ9GSJ0_9NEOP|nr:hypothetical protein PR048_022868 [Dryococelus australis]
MEFPLSAYHCTLQPNSSLWSFMFPLKTFYAHAIENCTSSNTGRVVTNLLLARLFFLPEAYVRAATMDISVKWFSQTLASFLTMIISPVKWIFRLTFSKQMKLKKLLPATRPAAISCSQPATHQSYSCDPVIDIYKTWFCSCGDKLSTQTKC